MKNLFLLFTGLGLVLLVHGQTPSRTVNFSPVISGVTNYSSINAALTNAPAGATIWVAAGTYHEPELVVPSGITMLGGFPQNSTTSTQRIYPGKATNSQLSVISGDYKHRVATVRGTLDGFLITKGYTYDSIGNQSGATLGGGLLVDGGLVVNCIITGNIAAQTAPQNGNIPGTFVASIGDIYCTDGTVLKPLYTFNNSTGKITATLSGGIPAGKTAQGIVFYVDNNATSGKFYVMGKVTPAQLQPWFNSSPMYDFPLTNITASASALNDFNGKSNSTSLNLQFATWHSSHPSTWYEGWDNDNPVPYCLNYNVPAGTQGDWYLPAAGELYKLWEVYPQMDACARDVLNWISSGQTMFQKSYYWSSTEYDTNNVWGLDTYSYPWGGWGLSARNKTQGGYTIPVTVKQTARLY